MYTTVFMVSFVQAFSFENTRQAKIGLHRIR